MSLSPNENGPRLCLICPHRLVLHIPPPLIKIWVDNSNVKIQCYQICGLKVSYLWPTNIEHFKFYIKNGIDNNNSHSITCHSVQSNQSVFLLAQDGLVVQINSTVGEERGLDVSLLFHLHPCYPSCPPDISVSSTGLSRTQCRNIRQKLLDKAAALPPEPMVHQLVECLKVNN